MSADFDALLAHKTHAAAHTFLRRKSRQEHPDGSFDNAKRWYPSAKERCTCCDSVRSPSRTWPNSYILHCRSADHIAELYDVDASAIRSLARRIEQLEAGDGDMIVRAFSRKRAAALLGAIAQHSPAAGLAEKAFELRSTVTEAALNHVSRTKPVTKEIAASAAIGL